MPYNKSTSKRTVQRTFRIPIEINEAIEKLAQDNDRDFTKQINHMLKKYLEMIDYNIPKVG